MSGEGSPIQPHDTRGIFSEDAVGLLDRCLETLATGLEAQLRPSVGLWDPECGGPTPEDHYGQLACALALRLLRPSDAWKNPRDAWLALDARRLGHAPFNRLLWLFLQGLDAEHAGHPTTPMEATAALARSRLQKRYPSNNWSLLAGLCRVLEAPSPSRRTRATSRMLELLDAWMTPQGGFIDYPERPAPGEQVATPATYHHKALFIVVVAAWYTDDLRWRPRIERLLKWGVLLWDGTGHVGGFGRSTHAVFGEACLLASLVLLGAGEAPHLGCAHATMLAGVLRRWQRQFREDGLLQLNPAATGNSRAGFDGYMHLSVYNAWVAAVLAWARHKVGTGTRPDVLTGIEFPNAPSSLAEDARAGLVRAGGSGRMLCLWATRGQPPQSFSRREVELRYAGGVPFHLAWRGQPLCPAPTRVLREALCAHPALAGWTPVLRIGGALYGLTDFESTRIEASENWVKITLSGSPVQLLRGNSGGFPARLVAALDWRFLGGSLARRDALKRRRVQDVHANMVLVMALKTPELLQQLVVSNQHGEAIELLNPCGHALVADFLPERKELETRVTGQTSCTAEEALLEVTLDSSIPGARGFCLPPIIIGPTKEGRSRLKLLWRR